MFGLTPTWAICSNGNTAKLEWNRGGVMSTKPAISPKRCKIGTRVLWRTNRKSHTRFRLVPKSSMISDNLDWTAEKLLRKRNFSEPTRKMWIKANTYTISGKCTCRSMILVSRIEKYKVYADIRVGSSGRGRQIQYPANVIPETKLWQEWLCFLANNWYYVLWIVRLSVKDKGHGADRVVLNQSYWT